MDKPTTHPIRFNLAFCCASRKFFKNREARRLKCCHSLISDYVCRLFFANHTQKRVLWNTILVCPVGNNLFHLPHTFINLLGSAQMLSYTNWLVILLFSQPNVFSLLPGSCCSFFCHFHSKFSFVYDNEKVFKSIIFSQNYKEKHFYVKCSWVLNGSGRNCFLGLG